MNGNSKRERVDSMIRRAVKDQLRKMALYDDDMRAVLGAHNNLDGIAHGAAYNITGDPYRMKELADIMAWKKAPKESQ